MAFGLAAWSATTYTANADATTAITSPSFSPAAGDWLYVIGFLDNSVNAVLTETTPTNTGTGLSWSLVVRENTETSNALRGTLFIWRAFNTGAQTGITVTATGGVASQLKCVAVVGFTGAAATQTGAAAVSLPYTAAATTPTLTAMTTTQAGSWCWLAAFNWTAYRSTLAAAAGQSAQIAVQDPNTAGDSVILTKENPQPSGSRSSGTSVTMSLTGGTASDQYHLAGWEVLAAGGTDATVPMGSAYAVTAAQPAATAAGNPVASAYAGSAADLGGGPGTWANTGNAVGGDDAAYSVWTVP